MTPERALTILVVDDDADARMVMRAALRKAGFEVRLAEGGEDGLRQFRAAPCDMVMLDVDMPDLNGLDVCATLRAEAGPMLPIVMVTGMVDLSWVTTAYERGATDFIAKPVSWALVGHRVRYLFRSHQAMRDLSAAEARNAAILNAIPDLLFELDSEGRFVDYRAPHSQPLAVPAETFIGRTLAEALPRAAAETCLAALREARDLGNASGAQYELPGENGSSWFELSVSRRHVADEARPRFIVLSRDITERKRSEAHITRLAYHDSLTGLPNRHAFLERVDREIRRCTELPGKLAVIFMDLDGFKTINDTLGHSAGDLLLQWTAERMRSCLRPSDLVSRSLGLDDKPGAATSAESHLARLGGDEFTALVLDINEPEDAIAVARRIGESMRQPFVLEGREITLTVSVGIALFPDDGRDGATLLRHADLAMYHAKTSGRDKTQVYRTALTERAMKRMELDASLRGALHREEFHLVYQPQIDPTSGRMPSVEALIRWTHPVRGLVSPLDFIPLAEETGLIHSIGHWVLRTACLDAARWRREGIALKVAVNLSPLQFRTPGLPQMVADVLAETGLPPALLELEVTEGALLENSASTCAMLQQLHDQGVQIALDDFGTGYSSLAYLTRMPISKIKIDRCFVTGLLDGGESEAIVRAVLAMAGSMGMKVTAEGVETIEQARALQAMNCDYLQGFYFSRPVPADAVQALTARDWTLAAVALATGPPAAPAPRHGPAFAIVIAGEAVHSDAGSVPAPFKTRATVPNTA